MESKRFSAAGKSFAMHEWRGSGPAALHVHHSDDEAWHVLEGELLFRYGDRTETARPGATVVPAGVVHTYTAAEDARYLIVLTPRLSALIAALQADRDPPIGMRSIGALIPSCWNELARALIQFRPRL